MKTSLFLTLIFFSSPGFSLNTLLSKSRRIVNRKDFHSPVRRAFASTTKKMSVLEALKYKPSSVKDTLRDYSAATYNKLLLKVDPHIASIIAARDPTLFTLFNENLRSLAINSLQVLLALDTLEGYHGEVWRLSDYLIEERKNKTLSDLLYGEKKEELEPGTKIIHPTFVSTSKVIREDNNYVSGDNFLMKIHSNGIGKDISEYSELPEEEEILFPLNSRYKFKEIEIITNEEGISRDVYVYEAYEVK